MTDSGGWRVLAPLEILQGESLPHGLVTFLSPVDLVVLGYQVVPEQTAPGQARMQFEEQAEGALEDVAREVEEAGGSVETRLVFTDDRDQTFDRVADETGSDVLLLSNPVASVDRLLVAVRGDVNADRIADVVATLVAGRDIAVTLFSSVPGEGKADERRALLSEIGDNLIAAGVPDDRLTREVVIRDGPLAAIIEAATDHDAVVVGESEPDLATFVFGELSERVADRSLAPVLVVKGAATEAPDAEDDTDQP